MPLGHLAGVNSWGRRELGSYYSLALPRFTLVERPQSNGIAEAFVKTLKRDHVRVNPIPDAATAVACPV